MLPPKSILLHLDSSTRAVLRVQAARLLAEVFEAEVTALYCVTPALLRYPFSLESTTAATATFLRDLETDRKNSAKEAFLEACAGSSRLKWAESDAPWGFARRSLYADLIVLGQRDADDPADEELPFDFVPSVLVNSGRPALVLPYVWSPGPIGYTVLVAWKETREAARAATAALPWLRRADRVHAVCYGEDSDGSLRALESRLKAHGVAATLHQGGPDRGDAGERLLSLSADVAADLLVMGSYGHSRAREWALGGATRSILQSMTVPVLMVH